MKEEDRSRADWKQLDDKLKEAFGFSDEQLAEEYDFYAAASAIEDVPPAPEGEFESILHRLREQLGEEMPKTTSGRDRPLPGKMVRENAEKALSVSRDPVGEAAGGAGEEIGDREETGQVVKIDLRQEDSRRESGESYAAEHGRAKRDGEEFAGHRELLLSEAEFSEAGSLRRTGLEAGRLESDRGREWMNGADGEETGDVTSGSKESEALSQGRRDRSDGVAGVKTETSGGEKADAASVGRMAEDRPDVKSREHAADEALNGIEAEELAAGEILTTGLETTGHGRTKGGGKAASWIRRKAGAETVRIEQTGLEKGSEFKTISKDGEGTEGKRKKRFWKKADAAEEEPMGAGGRETFAGLWQWMGVAAVAVMLGTVFFSPGIRVIGSKMYEYISAERNDKEAVVDNAENLPIEDELEQAYTRIRDELGIRVIELSYMPEGMVFENISIDRGVARMVFSYEGNYIFLIQVIQVVDDSFDFASDRTEYSVIYNDNLDEDIPIYANEYKEGCFEFNAKIVNGKSHYILIGTLDEDNFVMIVKQMKYYEKQG